MLIALFLCLSPVFLSPASGAAQTGEARITELEIGFDGRINPAPGRTYNLPRLAGDLTPYRAQDSGQREQTAGLLAPSLSRPIPPTPIRLELAGLIGGTDYEILVTRPQGSGQRERIAQFQVTRIRGGRGELSRSFRYRIAPGGSTELEVWLLANGSRRDREPVTVRAFSAGPVRVLRLGGETPASHQLQGELPGRGVWRRTEFSYRVEFVADAPGALPEAATLRDFAAVSVSRPVLEGISKRTRGILQEYVAQGGIVIVTGAGSGAPSPLFDQLRPAPALAADSAFRLFDGRIFLVEESAAPGDTAADLLGAVFEHRVTQLTRDLTEYRSELENGNFVLTFVEGGLPRLGAVPFYRNAARPGAALNLPFLLNRPERVRAERNRDQLPLPGRLNYLFWETGESRINPWWAVRDLAFPAVPTTRAVQGVDESPRLMRSVTGELTSRLNSQLSGYLFSVGLLLTIVGLLLLLTRRVWLTVAVAAAGGLLVFQVPAPQSDRASFHLEVLRGDAVNPREMLSSSLRLSVGLSKDEDESPQGAGELFDRGGRFNTDLATQRKLRPRDLPAIQLRRTAPDRVTLTNSTEFTLERAALIRNHYPTPIGELPAGESVQVEFTNTDTFITSQRYLGTPNDTSEERAGKALGLARSLSNRANTYTSHYDFIFQPFLGHNVFTQEGTLESSLGSLLGNTRPDESRTSFAGLRDWSLTQLWLEGSLGPRLEYDGTYLLATTSGYPSGEPASLLRERKTILLLRLDGRGEGSE